MQTATTTTTPNRRRKAQHDTAITTDTPVDEMTPRLRRRTARNAVAIIAGALADMGDVLPPSAVRLAERMVGVLAAVGHRRRYARTPAADLRAAAALLDAVHYDGV